MARYKIVEKDGRTIWFDSDEEYHQYEKSRTRNTLLLVGFVAIILVVCLVIILVNLRKVNGEHFEKSSIETVDNLPDNTSQYVVIDGKDLRIRMEPSENSETLKWKDGTNRHPKVGEKYKYLGESGDFYQIDFKGDKLWVSKKYTHLE